MKIEVEVPDWAARARIWILSETEPVAYKEKDGDWYVKTGRCSMCGKCCLNVRVPFGTVHDKWSLERRCLYLEKEVGDNDRWVCGLGINRPTNCSITIPNVEGCTVKFVKV